ncbi:MULTISPECIES: S24 family peptidase [unclassified Pseudomonas]|uniref:LexA family transcriptional regulator n=1 Tax=unclassified Pseudomonas TaxID=196821 RepID=UPI00244AC392|nr:MULTISPECIES: S24 family peptidase [unclassified Pseudomonas]MDH0896348.1 helix-turn-helix domain-containing protein [Pseudomonas sp. GD03875]MDH1066108.1 helix-turn-helix domain-containing protein [Pseudomonas sp. GD03985]
MKNWNELAKAKMKTLKITQESLAERLGVTQGAVAHWLSGRREPDLQTLGRLLEVLGLPPLQIGSGDSARVEANAELIGMMSGWDSATPLGDDEVAIPLYKEVEMAAGGGATEVVEVPGRLLRFAKSTLREAGVLEQNAACATVSGRSMERLIMDGATIGIDRGTTHIIDGEIYAFDQDGMLRVKYLYRMPGGGLRIRSENDDEYPDEILTAEEAQSIRILGWVFWWSTVRRRRGLSLAR